ncbi:FAD-binding oxidoreductase [Nocardiopsis composta]|uniref:Glycolate oxidase FAD binding subunit n=1 Tax=Nocardiopsis composta TaxID=157465 RepID=A0A7W8QHW0_9ACTN|nr:FAD-binding protein [Nocardiopsis composta]MBB5430068.1 glycolate oxidase FAD binding subunit [Nocardiopsis composta]
MTAATTPPQQRIRPATPAEAAEALRDTARDHPRVRIEGAGTAAGWGAPPPPADLVLDATGLTGITRYNPADMTVQVRAGTPLRELQRTLAEKGQRVAFDAARAGAGATAGGLIATADAGPAQQADGTLRDLVIGVTAVLADGGTVRSGGHVIKNVAGYDLAKLFHGSLGSLGLLAEVVLRLHPLPAATATARIRCAAADGAALAGRIMAAGLEPAAAERHDGHLLVRFEGGPGGVRARVRALAELAGEPPEVHRGDEEEALWRAAAATALGEPGDTVLRLGALPARGGPLLAAVERSAAHRGLGVETAGSVGVGVHTVRVRTGRPEARALFLADVRAAAAEQAAAVTVRRRDGLPERTDMWGPPPPTAALLRAVKDRFDPEGRFGPGRLAPWL